MFDMLGVIIKNLITKPATRRYPFEKRKDIKGTRGSIDVNIERCIFCKLCERKCPPDAIVVNKEEKSWELDRYRCVICGECVKICPVQCIDMNEFYAEPTFEMSKKKSIQLPKE